MGYAAQFNVAFADLILALSAVMRSARGQTLNLNVELQLHLKCGASRGREITPVAPRFDGNDGRARRRYGPHYGCVGVPRSADGGQSCGTAFASTTILGRYSLRPNQGGRTNSFLRLDRPTDRRVAVSTREGNPTRAEKQAAPVIPALEHALANHLVR